MKKSFAILCSAAVAAAMPVSASAASVIQGDTIKCSTNTFPNSRCNGSVTSTVPVVFSPNEAEFEIFATPNFSPLLTFDFEGGILTLASLGDRTISSTILTFSLTNGKIFTSVTGGGALANRASIVNGALQFDLRNVNFDPGQSFAFNVSAVPEPGTWMLMILGLGAVGFAMRRRHNAAVRYEFA